MMRTQAATIFLISGTDDLAREIAPALSAPGPWAFSVDQETWSGLGSAASKRASEHDIVLFEVPDCWPDALQGEREAIAGLAQRSICFALADETLSIAAARQLRDIGVCDVLPRSLEPNRICDILRFHLDARHAPPTEPESASGLVVAIAKARGGAGATTIAVNLARRLAGPGRSRRDKVSRKVVLLDLDVQFGDAGSYLDLEDNGAVRSLLDSRPAELPELLPGLVQRHASGLDVLCATAEILPLDSLAGDTVSALLAAAKQIWDFVVVDLPPGLVEWVAPVLETADLTLVATDTSVPSIRHTRRLISFFEDEGLPGPIQPVVCRSTRPMIKPRAVREAEAVLDRPLEHWLPDAGKTAREAIDRGQALIDSPSASRFTRAVDRLAASVDAVRSAGTKQEN